jgi:hypothetical protein
MIDARPSCAFFYIGIPNLPMLTRAGTTTLRCGAVANGYGAVVAFFVISGFVLARSLDRNGDPIRFVWHRLQQLNRCAEPPLSHAAKTVANAYDDGNAQQHSLKTPTPDVLVS